MSTLRKFASLCRLKDPIENDRTLSRTEIARLKAMPRYQGSETDLLGKTLRFVDAASFLSAYRQIFDEETYSFAARASNPLILDCGANIGLSVIYWKQLYPFSRIIAFEPDPDVFEVLTWNCRQRNLADIELVNRAVWKEQGILPFCAEGADAGHLDYGTSMDRNRRSVQVPTVRLRDYLNEPIDLLKLDIEGAEVEVLKDCQWHLDAVRNLFVEYHSFHGSEQHLDEIFFILKKNGFRVHVKSELVSASPFVDRLNYLGMDNSLNMFAYRD
jgi:FkbM family methyltransferase